MNTELSVLDAALHTEGDHINQLDMLADEIMIMMKYEVPVTKEWYAIRMRYVAIYRKLDWEYLIRLFRTSNSFMHNRTIQLVANMIAILMQWQVGIMSVEQYQFIIYNVKQIWMFYIVYYPDDTHCTMEDLISSMGHCAL